MKIEEFPTNKIIDRYDWAEAINGGGYPEVHPVFGTTASADPITLDNVQAVWEWWASSDGSDDERYYGEIDFGAILTLTDGRWAYLRAGADTTGWGCQDFSQAHVASSREELIVHGIPPTECEAMGIPKDLHQHHWVPRALLGQNAPLVGTCTVCNEHRTVNS